jgi:hypothetical protein
VHSFIRFVNYDDHAALIRELQRAESTLVVNTVCGRFAERFPKEFVVTLHDAVYTRPSAVDAMVGTFGEVFKELDFPMKLKVGE